MNVSIESEKFDIVNCPKNQAITKKLLALIESGNSVLFIGSGSSMRLKYPSWEDVLYDLNDLVKDRKIKELVKRKIECQEFLLAAEIIKHYTNTEDFENKFKKIFNFKSPSHDHLHQQLVKLKFRAFVTTNYDPVIEGALRSIQNQAFNCDVVISETTKKDIHKLFRSLNSISWNERYHLYLHGRFSYPSTTILSYGDYVHKYDGIDIKRNDKYPDLISGKITIEQFENIVELKNIARRTQHYKTAYLLMATQRIIYLGYGLRDPYLKKITDDIQDDFQIFYDDYHYALMSSNYAKNWDEKEYARVLEEWSLKGIELVFYSDNDSYTGIEDFVQSFSPKCYVSDYSDNYLIDKSSSVVKSELVSAVNIEDENINYKLNKKAKEVLQELKER